MTLLDFFILSIAVFFVANGVHAVTRKGMLLERLAFRLKVEDDLEEMSAMMQAEKEAILYAFEVGDIEEDEMNRQLAAVDDNKNFIKLSNYANNLRNKFVVKVMLAIAPAMTECVVCMSSFWSLVGMALYFTSTLYFALPIALPLAVAGAQYVTHKNID